MRKCQVCKQALRSQAACDEVLHVAIGIHVAILHLILQLRIATAPRPISVPGRRCALVFYEVAC